MLTLIRGQTSEQGKLSEIRATHNHKGLNISKRYNDS
jgi:hypothetical protein